MLQAAADRGIVWDIIVVGGGATGLGIAVDGAARGYRTLLVDKGDFGNATSSRSTKLIHGGIIGACLLEFLWRLDVGPWSFS